MFTWKIVLFVFSIELSLQDLTTTIKHSTSQSTSTQLMTTTQKYASEMMKQNEQIEKIIQSKPENTVQKNVHKDGKLLKFGKEDDINAGGKNFDDEENDDDDESYYDKSDAEDSDYHDTDYDENINLDLTFNTFGKKLENIDDDGSDSLPVFLEEPQSTYVMRSKPASLACKGAHALELIFKCSGSTQPVQPTSYDSHVDPHTGVRYLEITTQITRNLVDEYFGKGPFQCECVAWSPRGSIKSQSAIIEVAYIKKQFTESPTSVHVEIGTRTEMHCSPPLAIPMPNVTWLKNGMTIGGTSQSVILNTDNGLVFTHTSIQDMGNYTCVAENIAGRRMTEPAVLTIFTDGGWTQWGPWVDCKCQGKISQGQKRTRTCTNPLPLNGGALCGGPSIQKTQECLICQSGRWSSWSDWSPCGFDCIQTRRRSCMTLEAHLQLPEETAERVVCIGRDYQTAECRGGACHIDRDTDWPLYAGLAIIVIVCIAFGGILSYGAKRRQQLSPYTVTRTEINQLDTNRKPINYDVIPATQTIVTSNYCYPMTRNSNNNNNKHQQHFQQIGGRPISEHLYDEPHITANYLYPGTDKVSIDDSLSSSHYSRSLYSTESYGTTNNTCKTYKIPDNNYKKLMLLKLKG